MKKKDLGQTRQKTLEILNRLDAQTSKTARKWTYWKQKSEKKTRRDSSKLLVVNSNLAGGAKHRYIEDTAVFVSR